MPLTDFTSDTDAGNPSAPNNSGTTGGSATGSGSGGSANSGIPVPPAQNTPTSAPDDAVDVSEFLINYNDQFGASDPAKFRDAVIEQTLAVLISKNKANALLVGPAGVGKTRIVEDIARRIVSRHSSIPTQLAGCTVYELNFSAFLAGTKFAGAMEERINALIDFMEDPANKAILFIDEAHRVFESPVAQALKPAMARGAFRTIAATTTTEARNIRHDPALERRFSRLIVDELTLDQTAEILRDARSAYSTHYRYAVSVRDDVLDDLLVIAEDQLPATLHRPDKQLTLLDRAMADRVMRQHLMISEYEAAGDHAMASMLRQQSSFPLLTRQVHDVAGKLIRGTATAHKGSVQNLATTLHDTLCGQDAVIDQVTDTLTRNELGLFRTSQPVSWIFAGPSGTGKTETARLLATEMTGSDPIILNMAEYSHSADLAKIMGSNPGYVGSTSNREKPFDGLESNSHRVILLDEFEKAHRDVQRLFLSVLDTGTLTDAAGTVLDFSQAIIIATTNAGREVTGDKPTLGFAATTAAPAQLSDESLTKALAEHFDKELLGRFQLRVAFNTIDRATYRQICAEHYLRLLTEITTSKTHLATNLPASIPDDQLDALVDATYVTSLGARPARQAVQRWIEDRLIAAAAPVPSTTTVSTPATTSADETDDVDEPGDTTSAATPIAMRLHFPFRARNDLSAPGDDG